MSNAQPDTEVLEDTRAADSTSEQLEDGRHIEPTPRRESGTIDGANGPASRARLSPSARDPWEEVVPWREGALLEAVEVSEVVARDEYEYFDGSSTIAKVLKEMNDGGRLMYNVKFKDTRTEVISFDELVELDHGAHSLAQFQQTTSRSSDGTISNSESQSSMVATRRSAPKKAKQRDGFVDTRTILISSSDDDAGTTRKTRQNSSLKLRLRMASARSSGDGSEAASSNDDDSEDAPRRSKRLTRKETGRMTRSARAQTHLQLVDDESSDGRSDGAIPFLQSDVLPKSRKRKRRLRAGKPTVTIGGMNYDPVPPSAARRSGRSNKHTRNMEEAGLDDIYRSDSDPTQTQTASAPKVTLVKEVFVQLPRHDEFRQRHIQECDTCGQGGNTSQLIYCQGCSLAYHKHCLGNRTTREHLVTKISPGNFVLQCRRCINIHRRKDHQAPNLAMCQGCRQPSLACAPFRVKKSSAQEQKEREENEGDDPITHVNPDLINNPDTLLFRCTGCWRAFHFHHLPSRSPHGMDMDYDNDIERADTRFREYCRDWQCKECVDKPAKVGALIAWRPADPDDYPVAKNFDTVEEDEKQYLIKWEKLSHFRASWMPGAWTWGVTMAAMRKAFAKRESGPKMSFEDAIPEEFLRIDIVLDIRFKSIVDIRTEEVDKARVKEVDEALIKYKGLGYEDAVWEKVPEPEDGDRWTDFVTAYNDWVLGRYIHAPKGGPLKSRLEKARSQPFTKLEKKKQPDTIVGGELMKYQIDGLNWLYYQWYIMKNGILADEMGLGKTIQVIAFLATMVQDHNCFPFLIVVPNATCANWRREIKRWAPALRVVTYFGSRHSRDLAYKYEIFPEGSKDLRCHIVVTSYDAAADDDCRRFFKKIPWAGLVVDEGQRLKNDKSILYDALGSLKVPFRVLLTGTPLQNNARELFNLLQFLDESVNAKELEEEYAEMDREKVMKLHDLIRPSILRRTKAQVLTFLPPMAQIILPVSMSVLQKKLYLSILAKDPALLRAIFSDDQTLKKQERAKLSNILMQLRKCLCHPFVYSSVIEERTEIAAASHRNLVEASSKLQLLELLLPKLHERGHRVLVFSQFLNMLDVMEDFLDGLGMRYQRLDGSMGSLEKQKRIDEFNAPNSPLFAFLLSTRAGGVGINLATADTVIILDPDFNPHQDIQALSRAHRIGQKKKVLCYQLMTRSSAEEKIVQIGRKKMALDHVVVEQLDAEDIGDQDVESMLRHGAAELFAEKDSDQDVKYDAVSIEKLLDRSQIENTKSGEDNSAESQFSFARVWANDQGALEDALESRAEDDMAPNPDVWEGILKERERKAAEKAALVQQALGRGKRARMTVDYSTKEVELAGDTSPVQSRPAPRDDSDTDFQASDAVESADEEPEPITPDELPPVEKGANEATEKPVAAPKLTPPKKKPPKQPNPAVKSFQRAKISTRPPPTTAPPAPPKQPPTGPPPTDGARSPLATTANAQPHVHAHPLARPPPPLVACLACGQAHLQGSCPLKVAGVEHCPLCGLAHFGHARTCPHIGSETQVRQMMAAVRASPEPRVFKDAALKYLRGVKGHLVQKKKGDREAAAAAAASASGVGGVGVQEGLQQTKPLAYHGVGGGGGGGVGGRFDATNGSGHLSGENERTAGMGAMATGKENMGAGPGDGGLPQR